MRKFLKWLGYGGLALVALALIVALWIWFVSWRAIGSTDAPVAERLARPSAMQLADAPRQARVLGCVSCHGAGLRGHLMFDAPGVATIWAPNLTRVAARATDQQLAQAIRQGVGHDGRPLWVMPSGLLSRLEDGEVSALIAWIRSLPRGGAETPRVRVGPLGRLGIALGQFEPAPASLEHFRTVRAFDGGRAYAAGRRIAERVCADCHGPDLRGGHPGPDETAPDLAIAGAYDAAQFRTLMRTGRPPNGRDLGLMRRIAVQDLSGLSDDEIAALHAYLSERAQRAPQ